ncbi:glycoside hydrolase family 2 TIM barrel-domain containing protein [Roseimarinus sediminis]|uniref:glycoside hydrolase family 2 TIM barrel-domain containing protein n=1 Tax=Roseimarinus sediminis TaxID=1610899 RepID=UPI003D1B35D3
MKTMPLLLLLVFLLQACTSEKNENKVLFDAHWKFALNEQSGAEKPDYNDSSWRVLDLPHDYSIEQGFSQAHSSDASGGYAWGGIGWYRKSFVLPEATEGKRVAIRFDGVYRNSDVYLNGQHLGHRPYGYSTLSYELTPWLNAPGEENVLAVKVNTEAQPNSRWYTGAGIYRHVWLHISDHSHLVENGVLVQTSALSKENARLSIETEVSVQENETRSLGLKNTLSDADGKIVAESFTPLEAGSEIVRQPLVFDQPQWWSTNDPYLYHLQSELLAEGEVLDTYSTSYGLRTIEFCPDSGFFLNGERLLLKGLNNHHDGGPLGAACHDDTHERQLRLLKEMGANALRMSHNPPAPELLDWADRLGFVVINEIFDEWKQNKREHGYAAHFDEWYQRDVADWMRRDRNHPSIIAWSLGNEVPEQFMGEKGAQVLELLLAEARKHDRSRPFTAGCNGIPSINESRFGELIDLVGYNYHEALYDDDHQNFPGRIIYGSETVNYPYQPGDCFQMHTYEEWFNGQTAPWVAGEFLWTGFDYLGEAGIGEGGTGCAPWEEWTGWPRRSATCGIFDLCGFEKPGYYFRKALWNDEPMIFMAVQTDSSALDRTRVPFWGWPEVQPHWNHQREGDTLAVHVYTNVSEVELFINGKSHGKQKWELKKEAFPIWKVPYEKGSIEAVATLPDGSRVKHQLHTAAAPARIVLSADVPTSEHEQNIYYIKAELEDDSGKRVLFDERTLEFKVEGGGELLAVGNGDHQSSTPFTGNKMETYLGRCLAIVKAQSGKESVTITASSPGLPDAVFETGRD